ncbi:MAG: caspase family protein, partial [Solirubrobacteraceae bacterium]
GGRQGLPLSLSSGLSESPGEGVIVLTASTAGEDAQESDQLGGSFFSHYLVSALRGAADDDGDQVITVAEAFRYSREQTILASSRTLHGTQHPTFHYDLRGRADIPLADLSAARGRGRLTLPDNATWLVVRGGAPGTVVGEIMAGARRRTLLLAPGRYFVRGRMPDALLEGAIAVDADRNTTVDTATLERTSYARLVRKGAADGPHAADGPYAALVVQSSIIDDASPCLGLLAGWTFTRPEITLSPRVALCRSISSNPVLSATHDAVSGELRAARTWDIGRVAIDLGVTAGAELLRQGFDTLGRAPNRMAFGGHVGAGIGLAVPVGDRLYLGSEAAAQTHFFSLEDRARED